MRAACWQKRDHDHRRSEGHALPKTIVTAPDGPPSLPFVSPATLAGGFLFVSGHVAFAPGRSSSASSPLVGVIVEGGIADQTRQCLKNVEAVLRAGGAGLEDVVKVNAFLADPTADFDEFNRIYREYFPTDSPARTTVGVRLLQGLLVEIECIAFVGHQRI